ncbi:MAG: NfeD family protein [Bacteroidales bacterium]
MSFIAILLLILLGIFLFLVEFLLVPGVTVAGIAGFILIVGGVYMGYESLGTPEGHYILAGAVFLSVVVIAYSLRAKTWKRLMLDSTISGKVSRYEEEKVKVGDEGVTVTRLNPMGKVLINGEYLEAKSTGSYIEQKKKIRVISIKHFSVVVKSIEE